MKLNQLSLAVDDVAAASKLLERHFGMRPSGEAHKNFALLHDDDGLTLALMGAGAEPVSYPQTFHLGFVLASESEVEQLHDRLADDGVEIEEPLRRHGALTFGVQAPGGFRIGVRSRAASGHG